MARSLLIPALVPVLVASACGDDAPAASDDPHSATVEDATGDTWVEARDRRSDVVVNTDLASATITYHRDQLAVVVRYAEPLDPAARSSYSLALEVQNESGGELEVGWSRDAPKVTVTNSEGGDVECATGAATDEQAGTVTFTMAAHCFAAEPRLRVSELYATSGTGGRPPGAEDDLFTDGQVYSSDATSDWVDRPAP